MRYPPCRLPFTVQNCSFHATRPTTLSLSNESITTSQRSVNGIAVRIHSVVTGSPGSSGVSVLTGRAYAQLTASIVSGHRSELCWFSFRCDARSFRHRQARSRRSCSSMPEAPNSTCHERFLRAVRNGEPARDVSQRFLYVRLQCSLSCR